MITKYDLKYYSSLFTKKNRDAEKKFIAEGKKIVEEALYSNYICEVVFVTNSFLENESNLIALIEKRKIQILVVKNNEIEKLTDTVTPQGISAVFIYPQQTSIDPATVKTNLVACMENISDPGNMGTIFRNCDWFGIQDVILSKDCVDIYNPKVIRSSMGSIFHVNIYKDADLEESLKALKTSGFSILLADTTGENISSFKKSAKSVLILANEANGPSLEIKSFVDKKVTIKGKGNAESLNVANASAVLFYELTK